MIWVQGSWCFACSTVVGPETTPHSHEAGKEGGEVAGGIRLNARHVSCTASGLGSLAVMDCGR